jgi:hypothetical protein
LTTGFDIDRPIRIWFKIQRKLFAAKENGDKNGLEKTNLKNVLFHTIKNIFKKLFLIVSFVKLKRG